jgi:RNA polymerase-binding transcription factor DksA
MANATAGPRTDLDLDHFAEMLEGEQNRILTDLKRMDLREEAGGPGTSGSEIADYDQHQADQATETFLREQDEAMMVALRSELDQVEAAQAKLSAGSYGYCDRCGKDIPAERLEVLPFTIFCIDCAGDVEGRF